MASTGLILVTDDKQATRLLIRRALEAENFQVVEAANGQEALDAVPVHHPKVVVMDIVMPVMDGLTACAQLRQLKGFEDTPVLVLTGLAEDNTIEQIIEAGATDFLAKPIQWQELLYRIHRLFALVNLNEETKAAQRKLSLCLLTAYEEERKRIARDLHDEVGTALTSVKLDLQMLRDDVAVDNPQLLARFDNTIKLSDNTLALIRDTARMLRPPALDHSDLTELISNCVDEFGLRTGIKSQFNTEGQARKIPEVMSLALYRCVQESLTNISRHANAQSAEVRVIWKEASVSVHILDDGVGFEPAMVGRYQSFGLRGMRERAALLDGNLVIKSSHGLGTTVQVNIPEGGKR